MRPSSSELRSHFCDSAVSRSATREPNSTEAASSKTGKYWRPLRITWFRTSTLRSMQNKEVTSTNNSSRSLLCELPSLLRTGRLLVSCMECSTLTTWAWSTWQSTMGHSASWTTSPRTMSATRLTNMSDTATVASLSSWSGIWRDWLRHSTLWCHTSVWSSTSTSCTTPPSRRHTTRKWAINWGWQRQQRANS